jgi:prepilin-type N-terminal cleavage/methylation domain-containing protein
MSDRAAIKDPRRLLARRGFTLVELLVVIAIVGVLSAVVFPVVAKARQKSRNAVCVSNLRQLGLAMLSYADDNNDRLPLGLDSYWKQVERVPLYDAPWINQTLARRVPHDTWHCPADQGFMWWTPDFERVMTDLTPSCFQTTGQSYDYNLLMAWDYAYRRVSPVPVSSVKQPVSLAILKDAHFSWHNGNHPRDPKSRDLSDPPSWNALYLDGHVARKRLTWYRDYMVDTHKWWFTDNNPRIPPQS